MSAGKKSEKAGRILLLTLYCLIIVISGCSVEKFLQSKKNMLNTVISAFEDVKDEMNEKLDKLVNYEGEPNRPIDAINDLRNEIIDERELLDDLQQRLQDIFDEAHAEIEELKDAWQDIYSDILEGMFAQGQHIVNKVDEKLQQTSAKIYAIQASTNTKFSQLNTEMDNAMAIVDDWGQGTPAPENELHTVAESVAAIHGISLKQELVELMRLFEDFQVGPLPVRAGMTVDELVSFTITETIPEPLGFLNHGRLDPNSLVYFRLPVGWTFIDPPTVSSDTLTMDVCGDEAGSNYIRIVVLTDISVYDPNDDEIDITLNGVDIGHKPGIVEASITVLPGRTEVQEFVVLPEVDCEPYGWEWADLNYDARVDLFDLSILASDWLE